MGIRVLSRSILYFVLIKMYNASNEKEGQVSSRAFYEEYHGHKVEDLEVVLKELKTTSDSLIWTAGDSSLDNKYWFKDEKPAIGGYQNVLRPPTSICDVTYWLNYLSEQRCHQQSALQQCKSKKVAAINTAVEATTLGERKAKLRSQDIFLRDSISKDDVLIVSIGGNDVALAPTPVTIASFAGLILLPSWCIKSSFSFYGKKLPVNWWASCLSTFPPGFGHVRHLFGTRVQEYIELITSKTKPKKILICMIYYPDEAQDSSWADTPLGALGYNSNPAKLQTIIKRMFEEATSRIRIEGSEVIPVPLFHVLDGKNTEDYVARVEPSALGGKKMAEYLLDVIDNPLLVNEDMKYKAPAVDVMLNR